MSYLSNLSLLSRLLKHHWRQLKEIHHRRSISSPEASKFLRISWINHIWSVQSSKSPKLNLNLRKKRRTLKLIYRMKMSRQFLAPLTQIIAALNFHRCKEVQTSERKRRKMRLVQYSKFRPN